MMAIRTGPIPNMTVTKVDDENWSVKIDDVEVEDWPSDYDAYEVLAGVVRKHDLGSVAWTLIDDGFELVDIAR